MLRFHQHRRVVTCGLILGVAWAAWAAHTAWAATPVDLTNFQNEYACNTSTLIVRPQSVSDIQEAVRRNAFVRANGAGHSWNRPFFCSSSPDNKGGSVNIQVSTLRPLNITVMEDEQAVWVDAGVTTIHLIDFLADWVTEKAPAGWTLGAFPWYVYQTIAGAVSTGTHGSSTVHNSLSHQVLALDVVVANGSLVHLTPETHPFLMRAARVSVGQLGIITRVKLRIVKEQPVKREVRSMPVSQFLSAMKDAQDRFMSTGSLPADMQESEWFWEPQSGQIFMVSFTRGDVNNTDLRRSVLAKLTPDTTTVYDTSRSMLKATASSRFDDLPIKPNTDFSAPGGLTEAAYKSTQQLLQGTINAPVPRFPAVQAMDGDTGSGSGWQGVPWSVPAPKPVNVMYGLPTSASTLMDINKAGVLFIARNATVEASKAYLYQPSGLEIQIKNILFDQYEVSMPLSSMHACLEGLMQLVYGDDLDSKQDRREDRGFRSPPLFRLVGKEEGLLAQTSDGPRLFLNIEDYLYYNGPGGRKTNQKFKKIVGYLRSAAACGASGLSGGGGRLHWGKAGWPDAGCWRGDEEYPDTWCDMGCAVKQLDPTGKFAGSAQDRWTWKGVDLQACCAADGFQAKKPGCVCKVKHDKPKSACPPAPYYTYR